MFQGLSNPAVVALILCVGIIALSCIVVEGLYELIEAYAVPLSDPDHLVRRVGWKLG
jgi:hypothetical protein